MVDDRAILAIRQRSNAGIAAKDAAAAAAYLAEDAIIVASNGERVGGAAAMQAIFARMLADPDFRLLVRQPIEVSVGGDIAAERGEWRGTWSGRVVSGVYLARWRRDRDGWLVDSELYVRLSA